MAESPFNQTDIADFIREKNLCGSCQSSTLIGWPREHLDVDDLPRNAASDHQVECWYMVRCDYFRMTIPHPDRLAFCEAHKSVGNKETD